MPSETTPEEIPPIVMVAEGHMPEKVRHHMQQDLH